MRPPGASTGSRSAVIMATKLGYWRIEEILQLLGRGLNGAFAYIGADQLVYNCLDVDSKPLASTVDDKGLISCEVGLMFRVNLGRPKWKMVITVEPSDTYKLRLWKPLSLVKTGKVGEVMVEYGDIYCEDLKRFVEETYDEWAKKIHGAFIPMD